jgi:phage shock protein A
LRAARREVVRSVVAEKQLRHKREEQEAEVQRWVSRAELAVRSGRDDLARAALEHRRRLEAQRDRTEALRLEQRGEALGMKAELEKMERRLSALSARRGTLGVLAEQARAGGGSAGLGVSGGEPPTLAWDAMEERLDNIDVMFEAQREVDLELGGGPGPTGMTPAEVEARFAELEGNVRAAAAPEPGIDEELMQLKKKYRVET